MTRQLTALGIDKLRSGKVRREIRDAASGLSVLVTPAGAKSFVMRFRRLDGRPAKLTLGAFDPKAPELEGDPKIGMRLSLASARLLAAEVGRQRAMGKDVFAELAKGRQQRRIDLETKSFVFPLAVRQFVAEYLRNPQKKRGANRGWRDVARVLGLAHDREKDELTIIKGSLCDRWRDRPAGEISDHDVFAAIEEARRKGIPGLERRNRGLSDARGRHLGRALGKLFGWLLGKRMIAGDPCSGVSVPEPPEKRKRVLTSDEIRALWRATGELGYPFGPLLRGLLLTGCRRDEFAGLNYAELSEDGERWVIPGERTKNKFDLLVPLVPQVRDLIADASRFAKNSGNAGLVFTTTGRSAVSGFSKIKKRLDVLMRKELGDAFRAWRLHDIRRTVSTGMASIKVAPHVIEACLNHVSGFKSGVAGTYNVFQYEDEKRAALAAWASHLDQLVSGDGPANVVSIRGKR